MWRSRPETLQLSTWNIIAEANGAELRSEGVAIYSLGSGARGSQQ